MVKWISILLFFGVLIGSVTSQNLTQGFGYLESGAFAQAEEFFTPLHVERPQDKTVQICYGRAIGLNGRPQIAREHFFEMLADFPEDLEVKLNYAESMLWSKEFDQARDYYNNLLEEHPENTSARLGYANCLANLLEFESAWDEITKVLESDPTNSSARVSQKYIAFGLADRLMKKAEFDSALVLLRSNYLSHPQDIETTLNIANVQINQRDFSGAKQSYLSIIDESPTAQVQKALGLSLVNHLVHKNRKSSDHANIAVQIRNQSGDELPSDLVRQVEMRKVQSHIWTYRLGEARKALGEYQEKYPDHASAKILAAELAMYGRDFPEAQRHYQELLNQDSLSFDGNLGLASALRAQDFRKKALLAARTARSRYRFNQDAQQLHDQVVSPFRPTITAQVIGSEDNGGNQALTLQANAWVPISTVATILGNVRRRSTQNTADDRGLQITEQNIGVRLQVRPRLEASVLGGFLTAEGKDGKFDRFMMHASLQGQLGKSTTMTLGYRHELQDFNSALIRENLLQRHFFVKSNVSTPTGFGWYTEGYLTFQSDDNHRRLLFTSLYYTILRVPSWKAGINYQFMNFAESKPELYFSPENFHSVELFTQIGRDESSLGQAKIYYDALLAVGKQSSAAIANQLTYRIDAKLGYRIGPGFSLQVGALFTNISSATAAGFQYSQVSVGARWSFSPLKFARGD